VLGSSPLLPIPLTLC